MKLEYLLVFAVREFSDLISTHMDDHFYNLNVTEISVGKSTVKLRVCLRNLFADALVKCHHTRKQINSEL